jgi:serine/tyrosine/threonine adenylyltransferase
MLYESGFTFCPTPHALIPEVAGGKTEPMISFSNTYAHLPSAFFSPIKEKNNFSPTLIVFNHRLAHDLGLDFGLLRDEDFAGYFSAKDFIPGSEPVAMAYAGHQFGHFVPQLGDGRAMLLGEFLTPKKERFDVHLKGSGQTFYSRRGDGRSAIGPVLREYLLSEGMQALGIPTTRSLCAVRTGETVQREEGRPGAVLTRIAKSHVRVGTFQFFASRGDLANLKVLVDYTIDRLYPHLKNSPDRIVEFWQEFCDKQIQLVSQWMSMGFIHGVMNTDNMSISCETIDYGPCAFMDHFSFKKVFSSIDQNGRYAYSNQPQIAIWNFARLAECLIPLIDAPPEKTQKMFETELAVFHNDMMDAFFFRMGQKLGLEGSEDGVRNLVEIWLGFLEQHELDFTLSFIDLERLLENKQTFTNIESLEGFKDFFSSLKSNLVVSTALERMKKNNPFTIPRNHQVEKVIKASEKGDDSAFLRFIDVVRDPFRRSEGLTEFQRPPMPDEIVHRTFCGT